MIKGSEHRILFKVEVVEVVYITDERQMTKDKREEYLVHLVYAVGL